VVSGSDVQKLYQPDQLYLPIGLESSCPNFGQGTNIGLHDAKTALRTSRMLIPMLTFLSFFLFVTRPYLSTRILYNPQRARKRQPTRELILVAPSAGRNRLQPMIYFSHSTRELTDVSIAHLVLLAEDKVMAVSVKAKHGVVHGYQGWIGAGSSVGT